MENACVIDIKQCNGIANHSCDIPRRRYRIGRTPEGRFTITVDVPIGDYPSFSVDRDLMRLAGKSTLNLRHCTYEFLDPANFIPAIAVLDGALFEGPNVTCLAQQCTLLQK